VTPDARDLVVGFPEAYVADTQGVVPAPTSASTRVHALAPDLYRQCPVRYGSGRAACSSCGGMGGRYESRVTYDYNPVSDDEWVGCPCDGGYAVCTACGSSGSAHR
jgi:hypothetical protein